MISMIIKYILYSPITWIAKILTVLLSPLVVILSFYTKDGNLPRSLYWMQTHDAHLDEGQKPFYFGEATSKFDKYKKRVKWLVRNSAYSFQAVQLGFVNADNKIIYHKGEYSNDDGGWDITLVENKFKQLAFLIRLRKPSWFGKDRKFQLFLGWELQREEVTAKYTDSIQLWTKWV